MKLLPSRCTFCIHHAPVYSSLSFKATYIMCMFKRNLPPAHLAEWPGSFMCHCCNTGVERLLKQESEQKVDSGEENFPTAPAGESNPQPSDYGALPLSDPRPRFLRFRYFPSYQMSHRAPLYYLFPRVYDSTPAGNCVLVNSFFTHFCAISIDKLWVASGNTADL